VKGGPDQEAFSYPIAIDTRASKILVLFNLVKHQRSRAIGMPIIEMNENPNKIRRKGKFYK
jgi:hypothetical protein